MLIETLSERLIQPQHNAGPNPKWVSAGLLWLWGMPQGSDRLVIKNVLSDETAATQDLNNTFIPSVERKGVAALNTASTAGGALSYLLPRPILPGATEYTIVIWFSFDAADVSRQWLNFRSDFQQSLDVFSQTSNSITWGTDWAGAWNGASQKTLGGLSTGDLVVLCATVNQDGARFFDNSGFAGIKAGSAFTIAGTDCKIAAATASKLYGGAIFNRALPDNSAFSVQSNPFQLYEAEVIGVYNAASGTATLAGNAAAIASSSAQITTAIPVAGASVSQATGSGIFTTALTFQGSASAGVNVTGDLFTQIKFDGAALVQALAQAGLSTGIPFTAAGAAQAGSSGELTIQINLLGAAVANALVQGTLSGGASGFEGAAAGRASSSAQLTTAIPVAGNAQAYSNSSGGLTTVLPLNGVVAAINNVSGDLSVAIRFNAQALAQALASADFTVQIRLNGAALAQAAVSGTLAGTAPKPSLNPRYTVEIEPRLYVVESAPRLYEVAM